VQAPPPKKKKKKELFKSGVVAYTSNYSTFRLRQKDCEFEASLGYIGRPCLKKKEKKKKRMS
jgi:hypothetical protein